MKLPTQMLQFFTEESFKQDPSDPQVLLPHTLNDFLKDRQDEDLLEVIRICKKFEMEAELIGLHQYIKSERSRMPILDTVYYKVDFNQDMAKYGAYDFLYYGFSSIREHFYNSVKPVEVKLGKGDRKGELDVGTCFVIAPNRVCTAFHCIENMEWVRILGEDGKPVKVANIFVPSDSAIDIAFIETLEEPFKNIPQFALGEAKILDNVLTMGYPKLAKFNELQLAEVVSINSLLKSSVGGIVAQGKTYDTPKDSVLDYFLLNAKVKGGSSGGPVIDKYGYVIGIITNTSADMVDTEKIDELGFGICITSQTIKIFDQGPEQRELVREVECENVEQGFTTFFPKAYFNNQ